MSYYPLYQVSKYNYNRLVLEQHRIRLLERVVRVHEQRQRVHGQQD